MSKFSTVVVCFVFLYSQAGMGSKKVADFPDAKNKYDRAVARRAAEMFPEINRNWSYPNIPEGKGIESKSKFFKAGLELSEPDRKKGMAGIPYIRPTQELLKKGKWKEALEDLVNSKSVLSCDISVSVVVCSALVELMGEKEFHGYLKYFKEKIAPKVRCTQNTIFQNAIQNLLVSDKSVPTPGRLYYISNIDIYPFCKPQGNARGWNVFCMGKNAESTNIYVGFGAIFGEGSLTEELVLKHLYREFLREDSVPESLQKEHAEVRACYTSEVEGQKIGRELFFKECKEAQESAPFVTRINSPELTEFLRKMKIQAKRSKKKGPTKGKKGKRKGRR